MLISKKTNKKFEFLQVSHGLYFFYLTSVNASNPLYA